MLAEIHGWAGLIWSPLSSTSWELQRKTETNKLTKSERYVGNLQCDLQDRAFFADLQGWPGADNLSLPLLNLQGSRLKEVQVRCVVAWGGLTQRWEGMWHSPPWQRRKNWERPTWAALLPLEDVREGGGRWSSHGLARTWTCCSQRWFSQVGLIITLMMKNVPWELLLLLVSEKDQVKPIQSTHLAHRGHAGR